MHNFYQALKTLKALNWQKRPDYYFKPVTGNILILSESLAFGHLLTAGHFEISQAVMEQSGAATVSC